MRDYSKPAVRPTNPRFSSGPCAKWLGFSPAALAGASLGRSHRSAEGRERLRDIIEGTRHILEVPDTHLVGIVPGSDTGAFEMAMWNLLGARGVDALAWESFGRIWLRDVAAELKLGDARLIEAGFGELPDLATVDFTRDVVFTANGTTSGVRIPDYDWIAADREGLTLVDATSAAFAQRIDWDKVDCVTFSWQKVLGGEAAHGMLILSPRAVARLESYTPPWPLPKVFRLKKVDGSLNEAIFEGETINTPSMLCVEDYFQALQWARGIGGLDGLIARAEASAAVLFDWIDTTPWIENLARDRATWSNTSVCLRIIDPRVASLPRDRHMAFIRDMVHRLEDEQIAYDIASYRDAPPGLRIWTGATVETRDVEALLPWLEWSFGQSLSVLGGGSA